LHSFSCTGVESSEPWFSPSAQNLNFPRTTNIPEILSPPLSPPDVVTRGPQRNMAKAAALKLVTSFGDKSAKSKFFGTDDDRTPMNTIGVTPIADSAITPADKTSYLRHTKRSALNTPASARTATPGGYARQRLPSIGEMPTDVTPVVRRPSISVSGDSSSEFSEERSEIGRGRKRDGYDPASPMVERHQITKALPSPSPHSFTRVQQESRARNGSRHRKPDGLQIQWPPMESIITGDYMTTPELSSTSSVHPAGSVASSTNFAPVSGRRSPAPSEQSQRSNSVASPVVTGRSLDPYISSLESAQYTKSNRDRGRSSSRKPRAKESSRDRDRSGTRYIKPAKRSPTSPVPMSPDEYRGIGGTDDDRSEIASNISSVRRVRDTSQSTAKQGSKPSSRTRRASPESVKVRTSRPASRGSNRATSRRASPDTLTSTRYGRGRSKARDGSILRSPSSPLPMSPEARFYRLDQDDDAEDLRAAQADHERFRSRQRSVSRIRERGSSAVRAASPERRRRDRSTSRQPHGRDRSETREERRPTRRAASRDTRERVDSKMGDLLQTKDERQRKKEAAARELEERRRSLASRPSAPPIIHPEELSPIVYRESPRTFPSLSLGQIPQRSQTTSPPACPQARSMEAQVEKPKPQVGLPATPRAMQHPKYDPDSKDIPEVPQIPNSYNLPQHSTESLKESFSDSMYEIAPLPKTTFTPLPKSVYQAPARQQPPRSLSAPIMEEPQSPNPLPAALPMHPAFQATLPPSNRHTESHASTRKINPGDAQPGMLGYESRNNSPVYLNSPVQMGCIDETIESSTTPINPANNNLIPPPPPPPPSAPPIIKELQHLAKPPPPPPAPLYRMVSTTSGNSQPATVEIITEVDEAPVAPSRNSPPVAPSRNSPPVAPSRNSPDKFEPPPRTGSVNHNRGRSTDNSFSSRLSRATERIRSASRGASPQLNRTKSPPVSSPYESVPPATKWTLEQMQGKLPSNAQHAIERHPREVKADMIEGGMI
jgi:hypothetical protein